MRSVTPTARLPLPTSSGTIEQKTEGHEPSGTPPKAPHRHTRGTLQEKRKQQTPLREFFRRPQVKGQTIASLKIRMIGDLLGWGIALPAAIALLGAISGVAHGVGVAEPKHAGDALMLVDIVESAVEHGLRRGMLRFAQASSVLVPISLLNPLLARLATWNGSPPEPGMTWLGVFKVAHPDTDGL